jgi:hypothetical protein
MCPVSKTPTLRRNGRPAKPHHPADIEQIENRRQPNPDMSALYILSPQSWIVDCLMADFVVGRYKKAYLVWTSCAFLRDGASMESW